jgi:hypothetical protein
MNWRAESIGNPLPLSRPAKQLAKIMAKVDRPSGFRLRCCPGTGSSLRTGAAILRDPSIASGPGQLGAIQAVAPSLGVELTPINSRDAGEIERTVTGFARGANGGLIVTAGKLVVHRRLIIALAPGTNCPRPTRTVPSSGMEA